jgi:hypothetical protein
MSYHANFKFADGEQLALEVASVGDWGDWCRWAWSTPAMFKALHRLADTGMAKKSNPSAKAVANRLLGIGIVEGEFAVSEESDDSELD